MTLKDESPNATAHCRNGTRWIMPASEHASLSEAWQAGRAFWTGKGAWGEVLTIKLGDMVALTLWDEAALDEAEADAMAEHARDLLDNT